MNGCGQTPRAHVSVGVAQASSRTLGESNSGDMVLAPQKTKGDVRTSLVDWAT